MFETTSAFWFVAAVIAAFSAVVASIFFGNLLLPENEDEELKILKDFRTSSRAEIDRIVYPKSFYGYDPISQGKKHRTPRAV